MKASKIFILFIITLFSLISCEKDVLDKKPLSEVTPEIVWGDYNLTNYYVNGIYTRLMDYIRDLDCGTEIGDEGPSWAPIQSWNNGDITAFLNPLEDWFGEWGFYYQGIRSTNLVLENISKVKGNKTEVNKLKGQAYFLRAYFYSSLINLYGGVPIISKALTLNDNLSIPKKTYDECVNFIVTDLDSANALLPLEWDESNVGRATKGAALALKSRILLFAASPLHNSSNDAAKWQLASDAAKAVIDLGVYDLYPDYYELFHVDNNSEVIFDKQYAYPASTPNIEFDQNPQNFEGAQGIWRPTQDLVDSYEMSDGKKISDPTSGYDLQNPYVNRDPRFYASILYNGAIWREQTVETFDDGFNGPGEQDETFGDNSFTGYYTRKFITEDNPINQDDNRTGTNWILMRYAEVLLNYAEAELNLGHEAVTREYINMVRNRNTNMMPPIPDSVTGDELIERYRNERKIELAFEEIHFFDVRRWKIAPEILSVPVHKMQIIKNDDDSFTYSVEELEDRTWRDAMYYYPIPDSEIRKNKNLEQNPGW